MKNSLHTSLCCRRRLLHTLAQTLLCGSLAWGDMGSAWAVSLPEAIASALNISPTLLAAEKQKAITEQQRLQALAAYFPTLDFSNAVGNERTDSPSTRAAGKGAPSLAHHEVRTSLTQNLFDGFNTTNTVKKAGAVQKAADWSYLTAVNGVTMEAIERFLEVQKQRELLARIQQFAEVQAEFLNKIQAWYEGGAGTVAEVWQTESRLAMTLSSVASAESQHNTAIDEFQRVFGFAPEQLDPAPSIGNQLPRALEQAVEIALQNHPSLLEAQFNLEAAQAAQEGAQAGLWPSLQFSVENTRTNNSSGFEGDTESTAAMLRFNYNFFRGGGDLARSREYASRLEQAQAQSEQIKQSVRKNVEKSWRTILESRQRFASLQQHEAVSTQVTAAYHEQFLADQRSLLDVLNAENELFTAQNNRIGAYYGLLLEEYRLMLNMGTLQVPMGVAQKSRPTPVIKLPTPGSNPALHDAHLTLRSTQLTLQEGITLYDAPRPTAKQVKQLPNGGTLRILQSKQSWFLVEDEGGTQGWLQGATASEQPIQSGMFILPVATEPQPGEASAQATHSIEGPEHPVEVPDTPASVQPVLPIAEIPDLLPPE
ncbi:MAG: TolC family outer membrane protein [Magnetococcales bacterium]|nr:TolC family outer membrane protein [Magnetococcales bacterium]MBF0116055.1 TolC family outer membrane protein [Magnetococcales bacterium]